MVELELKRDRIVIRFGTKKWEWVLEPRYWRNTLIWAAFLFIVPTVCLLCQPRPDQYDDFGQYLRRHCDASGADDHWHGTHELRPSILHRRGRLYGGAAQHRLRLGTFDHIAFCHPDVYDLRLFYSARWSSWRGVFTTFS